MREKNLTPLVLPVPTKYNARPLTKLEHKKIEEDISKRVEAMRQDLIKKKKKAKMRHAKRKNMGPSTFRRCKLQQRPIAKCYGKKDKGRKTNGKNFSSI